MKGAACRWGFRLGTATEGNFELRKERNCTIYVGKAKAMISCVVTVQAADLHLCFQICKKRVFSRHISYEPHHEKTGFSHMRKQRCRSAVR